MPALQGKQPSQVKQPTQKPQPAQPEMQDLAEQGTSPERIQRLAAAPHMLTPRDVQVIQRTYGNRAALGILGSRSAPLPPIGHMTRRVAVQPKLTVGAPQDKYEQEADQVAEQVMTMPAPATTQPVQREKEDSAEQAAVDGTPANSTLAQRQASTRRKAQVSRATGGVIQRLQIYTVTAKAHLREQPEKEGTQRGSERRLQWLRGPGALEPDHAILVKQSDKSIEDRRGTTGEGGDVFKWHWVKVIGGDLRGYEGYLRKDKIRALRDVPEDKLGWVTNSTKLRAQTGEPTEGVSKGDMFEIIDDRAYVRRGNHKERFVKVKMLTGSSAGITGFLRDGKRYMSGEELIKEEEVEPEQELEEARESKPKPDEALAGGDALDGIEKLREALTNLDKYRQYVQDKLEIDRIDLQAAQWISEFLEGDFGKQLLPNAVDEVKAQWDTWISEAAEDISNQAATMRKRVMDGDKILCDGKKKQEVRLTEARAMYEEGKTAYEKAQNPLERMLNRDFLIEKTKEKARISNEKAVNKSKKDSSMAQFGKYSGVKENLAEAVFKPGTGMGQEQVAGGIAEGGDPVLGGSAGWRTTDNTSDRESLNVTGGTTKEGYGTASDKTWGAAGGQGKFKEGEYYGLLGKDDSGLPDTKEAATWWADKMLGKWWDPGNFQFTKQKATFTTPKIWLLKPFPPLASFGMMIPVYPGVGVKLEAKVKAKAFFAGRGTLNWGHLFENMDRNKAIQQDAAKIFEKNQKVKNDIKLLEVEKREAGKEPDPNKRTEKQRAIQQKYKKLEAERLQTQEAFTQKNKQSRWDNPKFGFDIAGDLKAGIGGEVFGGVALGIPAANVSGGLYGELNFDAGASVGLKGEFARENGKWKSAKFGGTFKIDGNVTAELGAKLGFQILFFSHDLLKFKFADWTIGSFLLDAEATGGKGGGFKVNDKQFRWFKGKPPIETQVVEAKEKAEGSKEKLEKKLGGKLEEDTGSYGQAMVTTEKIERKLAKIEKAKGLIEDIRGAKGATEEKLARLQEVEAQIKAWQGKVQQLQSDLGPKLDELAKLQADVEKTGIIKRKSMKQKAEADIDAYASKAYEMLRQSDRRALPIYQGYKDALKAYEPAKKDVDDYIAKDEHQKTRDYVGKEKAISAQQIKIREVETEKQQLATKLQEIQGRTEGGRFHRASKEFKSKKEQDAQQIKAQIARVEEKLKEEKTKLEQLQKEKTAIRKANTKEIAGYKKLRDKAKGLKADLDKVKQDVADIQGTIARAQSHIDAAKAMSDAIGKHGKKFEDVKQIKEKQASYTKEMNKVLESAQDAQMEVKIEKAFSEGFKGGKLRKVNSKSKEDKLRRSEWLARAQLQQKVLTSTMSKVKANYAEVVGPRGNKMSPELGGRYQALIMDELNKHDGAVLDERFKGLDEGQFKQEIQWLTGVVERRLQGYKV